MWNLLDTLLDTNGRVGSILDGVMTVACLTLWPSVAIILYVLLWGV